MTEQEGMRVRDGARGNEIDSESERERERERLRVGGNESEIVSVF